LNQEEQGPRQAKRVEKGESPNAGAVFRSRRSKEIAGRKKWKKKEIPAPHYTNGSRRNKKGNPGTGGPEMASIPLRKLFKKAKKPWRGGEGKGCPKELQVDGLNKGGWCRTSQKRGIADSSGHVRH